MSEIKYEIIKNDILRRIKSSELKPGDQIPPQRLLVESYNVSRITIKKAISDLINEGFIEHVPGKKGVFVKSFIQNSSKTIVVALDDITNYYDAHILKGIEDSLWKKNYHTIICNANRNMNKIEEYFHSFDFSKIDGIIYLPVIDNNYLQRNKQILKIFKDNNKPFVLVDQTIPDFPAHSVTSDHRYSAFQLCKALIEKGHTNILIGKGLDCSTVQERISGVRDAFQLTNTPLSDNKILNINDNNLPKGFTIDSPELVHIEHMIRNAGEFTAFYAVNNRIMKAVLLTLIKMGYDVNTLQLALHNEINKPVHPYTDKIPHIIPPLYQLGSESATLLLRVLSNDIENTYHLTINSTINLEGLQ